ncbi:MAG: type I restriction enzyme HsdR N-terminal domain-containing protein [Bacteroidales bacterium]
MERLNLPEGKFSIRKEGEKQLIFDRWRRKYVALTPEEWVRQHILLYLTTNLGYPSGLISVEWSVRSGLKQLRADAVVRTRQGNPLMIIECKAPHVSLNQDTFDQAVRYNMPLQAGYILLTNGREHYVLKLNYKTGKAGFIDHIPDYNELTKS